MVARVPFPPPKCRGDRLDHGVVNVAAERHPRYASGRGISSCRSGPTHSLIVPLYIRRHRVRRLTGHSVAERAGHVSPEIYYMAKGIVKWFNPTKGYGFIQPQGGGKDVFIHISAVEKAGLSTLNEGQVIEYEEVANRGKSSAENLKVQR
jgi:CspA family cold shock protein